MSNDLENLDKLSPLQRAAFALQEMRAKLDVIERQQTEPIAVVGMGCRFPGGADNPEAFWQLLQDGVDAIAEVPSSRWNVDAYYDANPETPGKTYTKQGGFLGDVDGFDAEFFGLTPREAISMDPQQRLLLEVSWEALEQAGIAPEKLKGSQSGVFIGIGVNEYAEASMLGESSELDVYSATGNALSVAAGRLSYTLGLRGPSLVIDTACSSSLVAVHLACQSLRAKECDLALTGGVYLMLSPQTTIAMAKMRALSADGRCKTFDAAADGYGRGEGCGVVVLKRLSDAMAHQDTILGLIRGSAINQDGASSGLTVPNGLAQQQVIHTALANAQIAPAQISYVEAHGTGTNLGDPVEVKSLGKIFAQHPFGRSPLWIGSVKTNIGHLEAAAGIAGLIKVLLAMQHREIPPNLHFRQLNPHIAHEQLPIQIPTQRSPWPETEDGKRFAGVSSFGFSGTNAHVVLESPPGSERVDSPWQRPLHLLSLSAKTATALKQLAKRFADDLIQHSSPSFADICFSANTGRSHFNHRLAIVAASSEAAIEQLTNFQASSPPTAAAIKLPKIAFLFSRQDGQSLSMGRELYQTHPLFRQTIEQCDELLRPYLERSLVSVLYSESDELPSLDGTDYWRSALFSVEYALAQLWQSWGIEADLVMGYGVGEYAAACVAGVLSLEDSLLLLMKSQLPNFEQVVEQVSFSEPHIDILSAMTGQRLERETFTDPRFWETPIDDSEQLLAGLSAVKQQNDDIFIEMGPNSKQIEQEGQDFKSSASIWLPSLESGQADWHVLLNSLGTLYTKGFDINWEVFERPYQRSRLTLPTYPFERQRYWLETQKSPAFPSRLLGQESSHPLLGQRLTSPLPQIQFESQFCLNSLPLVKDHRLNGLPVVNLVLYLEMALAGTREVFGKSVQCIDDLAIPAALILPEQGSQTVQLIITPEAAHLAAFEIYRWSPNGTAKTSTWKSHAKGKVLLGEVEPTTSDQLSLSLQQIQARCPEQISSTELYQLVEKRGAHLGPSCQCLQRVWRGAGEALGQITTPAESQKFDPDYTLPLGAIDACFQLLGVANSAQSDRSYLILGCERFRVYGSSRQPLWCQATVPAPDDGGASPILTGDVTLFDETGQVLVEIKQAKLKPIDYQALQANTQKNPSKMTAVQTNGSLPSARLSQEQLIAATATERQHLLETYLLETLANSLQLPVSKLSVDQTLVERIDSLMAFELKNRIETDLQLAVPLEQFFGENTIAHLAEGLLEQFVADRLILADPSSNHHEDMEEVLI